MTIKTKLHKTVIASAISAFMPFQALANVIFTEYVEGSSNNKAIEISNLGSSTVDLASEEYRVGLYSNGSADESRFLELTGTLEPNQSLVIYNSGADEAFVFADGVASEVTYFNGDDALVLTKAGTVVDSIGQVGSDPGSEWTDSNDADFSTKEKTIRRLASITNGDTTIDDEFPGATNEWLTFDQNTSDGLGCPGETACGASAAEGVLIFSEYIEGSSSNKAIELTNIGDAEIDFGAANYVVSLYSNGNTESTNTETLTGTLAVGASIVIYNEGADDAFKFDAPTGIASTVTYFNGDDAIVVTKDDVVIDSFGQLGTDPGSAWLDDNYADFSTANKTLRRKADVTSGDTVADDAFPGDNNEWVAFDQDTADGLSCGGVEACASDGSGDDSGDDSGSDDSTDDSGTDTPVDVENTVIITEYIEGSSNNKAIEISNLGTENVDLAAQGYRLEAYNNGGTDVSNSLDLYGILVPNSSIVVYNGGATEDFIKEAPQGIASNVTYFNGDDAIALLKNGVVVDSFGVKGEDPGSAWTSGDFTTQNATLRRLASVTTGDNVVDDAFPGDSNQWLSFDIDTADGLGCPGESACTGSEPMPLADEDNSGDDSSDTGLCLNCPDITKVADASTFIDGDYYADALAAEDTQLRDAINTIISTNHIKLSYSEVWSVLTYSDQDPDNTDNVILLYKGNSIPKWSNGSGAQSSNQDYWNREHVWSKSHGFPDDNQMAYTDAHHLRPADVSMNTTRSNYDFETSSDAVTEAPENFYDTSLRTWEPRDEVKGDVARMMFYMDVRYAGASADNTPDLVLVDNIGTENDSAEFGKLCTLYEWHLTDTVSDMEVQRNNAVYEYQGNRNPFIDHPEWADTIFGPACGNDPVVENNAPLAVIDAPANIASGFEITLDGSGSSDAEGSALTYQWSYVSGPQVDVSGTDATLSFTAPVVSERDVLIVSLTVSDGELSETAQVSINILPVEETRDTSSGSFGGFALLTLALLGMRRRLR